MENEKQWIRVARKYLISSLSPVPHELNEIDWKVGLSEDKKRLSEHISAFSNQEGGGFFVFGISSDSTVVGIRKDEGEIIINKISNLARAAIDPYLVIDHHFELYGGKEVLFICIPESVEKPVHIRGKSIEFSFIRSGGQTRKMSKQEIARAVLCSKTLNFEEIESRSCTDDEVLSLLDHEKLFELLNITLSESKDYIMEQLVNNKLIYRNNSKISITNLGALVAARNFEDFPGMERYSVRVIKYKGNSRLEADREKEFSEGYGVCFEKIIEYIVGELPTNEVIKDAIRRDVLVYPFIAIREIVANALIHRDFMITKTHIMIEIFSDRMEITNPGNLLPTIRIERLIDAPPESRNEIFAKIMRRMGICEERGSGIDKAIDAIELFALPPLQFIEAEQSFKTIVYRPRKFKDMTQDERIRACYQHCCLKHVFDSKMTNTTFRKRLGLTKTQYPAAWEIIKKSIESKYIKLGDENSKSRRYAYYVPFWV